MAATRTRTSTRTRRRLAPRPVRHAAAAVAHAVTAARRTGVAAASGDRPYLAALLVLLVTSTIMLSGPLQNHLDARERVEHLEEKLAVLEAENERLGARRDDLHDPETIELMAREELGLIRPGEVAYAVVPPELDRPRIAPPRDPEPDDAPWYRRAWQAVSALFR